jgi:hypothetical protein
MNLLYVFKEARRYLQRPAQCAHADAKEEA